MGLLIENIKVRAGERRTGAVFFVSFQSLSGDPVASDAVAPMLVDLGGDLRELIRLGCDLGMLLLHMVVDGLHAGLVLGRTWGMRAL